MGGARVETAVLEVSAGERAKALARTDEARSVGGARLRRAIEAAGLSVRGVAASSGIAETILRDICNGVRALSDERLLRMPRSVRRAYHEAALLELEEGEPPTSLSPERAALRLTEAHGATCGGLREALADGEIDARERSSLSRLVRAEIDAMHGVERAVFHASTRCR